MHLRINLASYPINFFFFNTLTFRKKKLPRVQYLWKFLVKVCFGEIGSVILGSSNTSLFHANADGLLTEKK